MIDRAQAAGETLEHVAEEFLAGQVRFYPSN